MIDLRYPIGKYQPQPFSVELKSKWTKDIKCLPEALEVAVNNLDEYQLNTPYREDGWTLKQVVHHVADSHMNAYIRFRLGLTEDNPTIKPYDENAWNRLPDIEIVPVNISLTLLHALHHRWYELLKNMKDDDFKRTVVHPEHGRQMSLWMLLGLYVWHGKHHIAHITSLRDEKKW